MEVSLRATIQPALDEQYESAEDVRGILMNVKGLADLGKKSQDVLYGQKITTLQLIQSSPISVSHLKDLL